MNKSILILLAVETNTVSAFLFLGAYTSVHSQKSLRGAQRRGNLDDSIQRTLSKWVRFAYTGRYVRNVVVFFRVALI
ncbi:hypothetical protein JYU19_02255 [bacterium AH-315-J21]|nr:hypothetical protein [bacterium AH-315-J21]